MSRPLIETVPEEYRLYRSYGHSRTISFLHACPGWVMVLFWVVVFMLIAGRLK